MELLVDRNRIGAVERAAVAQEIAAAIRHGPGNKLTRVDNAVEAMAEGGTLAVAVHADGDVVALSVADTGAGFAGGAALLPFSSTKPGHAGIGLNVARRIAERYSGRLGIAAGRGGGLVEI